MKLIKWVALCMILSNASLVDAALLSYSFDDDTADQSRAGYSDLARISVLFDSNTGDYTITLTSTLANPFNGWLKINANMVNPDTQNFVMSQAYFFDNLRNITLAGPTTTVAFSGNSPSLKWWQAGDRVASSSEHFGIASDAQPSSFKSNLDQGFISTEWSTDDFPNSKISTITPVPLPASVGLFGSAILLISLFRRRSTDAKSRGLASSAGPCEPRGAKGALG